MKRWFFYSLLIVLLFTTQAFSSDFGCKGFCGAFAISLDKDQEVVNINSEKLFIPASITKLYTLIGALEVLGENYTYKTKFYYFDSNLGIKTSGDPTLYPSLLENIVKEAVKENHIEKVNYVYIDDRAFDRKEFFGKGWMWDDANPIVSAAFLKLPKGSVLKMIDRYTGVKIFYDTVKRSLEDVGIAVKGGMKLGYISDKKYTPIYIHRSAPLSKILQNTIQASDNQSAEQIFRTIGFAFKKKGNTINSVAAIIKVVKDTTGYGINDFKIVDGSGLSRYNLVSPRLTVLILKYMYKKYGNKLLNILSYSKGKGTLGSRFSFDFWGKTGTLTGVSGLSGILKTQKGRWVIVSLFENNFLEAKFDPKEYENKIITYIYENF